jgi:hypothetical protein
VTPKFISTSKFLCSQAHISDERTGLSFIHVYAAGLRQPSLSRVPVPWESWPYFTVSDLRLPFSSPPTTRRVTVEVFEPASTLVYKVKVILRPTVQSASPSWNKAPIWGLRPDLYYCQTVAVLLIWGALRREDGSVVCQTRSAIISLLSGCTVCILQVIKCMYIQHTRIQGLCQFRFSTAGNSLLLVAPATTAV